MAARRRTKTAEKGAPILLIDAGLAAGWRRSTPDLGQLDEVVEAAASAVAERVVLADASLKWSLPDDQQEKFERYRATATVLCAPGGTTGGHHAFIATAARAAAKKGREVFVLSALDLGEGPWKLASLRRPGDRWQIALPED